MTKNDFYTDYTIRQLYKDHLKTYVNRVNSINNRTYSEDPTIYAWDLLNEPRWCVWLCLLCVSAAPVLSSWGSALACQQPLVSWHLTCRASSLQTEARARAGAEAACLCSTGCGYALQTWLEEMSVYMKAIDPNHMVGLGSEGFYSTTCDRCEPALCQSMAALTHIRCRQHGCCT